MADKRAYFHTDVGYFWNPKVMPMLDDSPRAVLLHLACIAYSAQHLTDGVVPVRPVMRSVCASHSDLQCAIENGLLVALDATTVEVHDYLLHQRSSEKVKQASDNGVRAAEARWASTNGNAGGNAKRNAGGNAKRERKTLTSELRADVVQLLDHLDSRIEGNGARKPGRTKSNTEAARLLIDRDKRSVTDVIAVIDWATADDFWKPNILSMSKLREKFDHLWLKFNSQSAARSAYRIEEDWSA